MALSIGNSKVSKMYHGDTECKKAYLGDTLVLDNSAPKEIKWEQFNMLPTGNWNTICYGNGKFVAVQTTNTNISSYSKDGKNWTQTTLPTAGYWERIAYGGGLYVLIPTQNTVTTTFYSSDGINFKPIYIPKGYWRDLAYGNGKFVAVRGDSYYTSYNSCAYATINQDNSLSQFSTMNMPFSSAWSSIAFGNGKFVAGSDYNAMAYSEDGINWEKGIYDSSVKNIVRIAFGNNVFVAISDSNVIFYSEDGITWNRSITNIPSSSYLRSISYGNGVFVVVCGGFDSYRDIIFLSYDGKVFEQSILPSKQHWRDIAFGNNTFCTVAYEKYGASVGAYAVT